MNCDYWQDVLLFEPLPYTERIYTSLSNLDQALVLHPYTGGGGGRGSSVGRARDSW